MSNHNNDHTFQGRTKKLSGWVKRMIQPAKDSTSLNSSNQLTTPGGVADSRAVDSRAADPRVVNPRLVSAKKSIPNARPSAPGEEDSTSMKVLWDSEPRRAKLEPKSADRDTETEVIDNVSITPLFSLCSSSVKSSTFSDSHSLQSTRATVMSGRTVETNSSTVAIPPASIMDRTRASSATAPASTASSVGPSTPTHSMGHQHHHLHHTHTSRPSSVGHTQMQREDSNDTINSSTTIK